MRAQRPRRRRRRSSRPTAPRPAAPPEPPAPPPPAATPAPPAVSGRPAQAPGHPGPPAPAPECRTQPPDSRPHRATRAHIIVGHRHQSWQPARRWRTRSPRPQRTEKSAAECVRSRHSRHRTTTDSPTGPLDQMPPPLRYKIRADPARSFAHRRIAERSYAAAHDDSIGHGDDRAQITRSGAVPESDNVGKAAQIGGSRAAWALRSVTHCGVRGSSARVAPSRADECCPGFLPGSSGDVGGDDVSGVPVQRGPVAVIAHRGAWIGVEAASCTSRNGTPASSAAMMNACRSRRRSGRSAHRCVR